MPDSIPSQGQAEHAAGLRDALIALAVAGSNPGAQCSVLREGECIVDFSVGHAAPSTPLTPEMLMPWMSATKAIAAVAIMQCVERERITLDTPIAEVLPAFGARGKHTITLHHILTHTSGFRAAPFEYPRDDWSTIIERICDARLEPNWTPGQKAGYHINTSWFILGEVIRLLTEQNFDEYAKQYIFGPLGMSDCWAGMSADRFEAYGPRIAKMWDTSRTPPKQRDWAGRAKLTGIAPSSNGVGPMQQAVLFYEAMRLGGAITRKDGGEARILNPDTVSAMTHRHREGMHDHTFKAIVDYGLGLILDAKRHGQPVVPYGYGPHASDATFGHSGNQSTAVFCDPTHRLVVALALNGTPGELAHQQRIHRLLGTLYEDLGIAS